jgi:2-keto-4-pentenoate hydratase/2-oxohepta-3-ene-1,7-dioic acid hydratase in catechol pathway
MKLCRFLPLQSARRAGDPASEPRTGIIAGDSISEIRGPLWGSRERTGQQFPASSVKFLSPCAPGKIVCVGKNYADHAYEMGGPPPKEPLIFFKPPSSVISPGEQIVLTPLSKRIDYEGELAFVMGKRCRNLKPSDDTKSLIAGYTCLNDVTARDIQRSDSQWTRGKGFDTFCPFGPILETELDLPSTTVETFVNGVRKQSGRVSELLFSVDVIIRWIAQVMTLEPGDLIATGTPEGVGPLAAGDVVEVVVSGIGTLRNPVIAAQE